MSGAEGAGGAEGAAPHRGRAAAEGRPRRVPGEGGVYGRRQGHALREEQAARLARLLPSLSPPEPAPGLVIDPAALFPFPVAAVEVEIGFGGGEHLAARAAAHPGTGFLGAEPFVNGVAKLLAAVEARGLANVRARGADAAPLLAALRPGSVARAHLLYPDPWPKRRQRKRRFLSDATLALLARAVRPGGELRFATDIDDYAAWALARVHRSKDWSWDARGAADWREPWEGWPGTRYEAKAKAEGRVPSYLTFRRA